VLCAACVGAATRDATAQSLEELRSLSIEDLAKVEVTSVSKRPEPLSRAAASVFVITGEDIRRSGARTLPEALRLAPNLEVAQVNAHDYAISARGFNSFQAAIKMLVLVDGRSVYSPLHAGVFWDANEVMLEDVDRIEVISGPGGTLWGANAFSGVINIITKNSRDTQGGLVRGTYGSVNRDSAARFGGKAGEVGTWRAYGMESWRGHTDLANDTAVKDNWRERQGGFRSDWQVGTDYLTVQGDAYDNPEEGGSRSSGANALARWTRKLADGAAVEVQTYINKADRDAPGSGASADSYDLQAQHSFTPWKSHNVVWGGGIRADYTKLIFTPGSLFVIDPPEHTAYVANVFGQDQIDLTDDLVLTLGSKFEYNDFTGFEYMPDVRLAWNVTDTALLWGAVSRAVRTPSRLDRGLHSTSTTLISTPQATDFTSEKVLAYEVGYRGRPMDDLSVSVTLFYHDYDDLRVLEQLPNTAVPAPTLGTFIISNKMHGFNAGVESWADYRVLSWWRLSTGLSLLRERFHLEPGATTSSLNQHQGNNPKYQAQIRSRMNLTDEIELDAGIRAIDRLHMPTIPEYMEADVRLGWRINENLELEAIGFNLWDPHHVESFNTGTLSEIRRGVSVGARVRF
jgi:iron complex outermembrane receptor protein